MAAWYFDTSALVKAYARERGTTWVQNLLDTAAGQRVATARVSGPELIAALFRKVRMGELTSAEAQRLAAAFRLDWETRYRIVEVTSTVAESAMDLAERFGLRGYDALHLAVALLLHEERRREPLSPLSFVSADKYQLEVAAAEGLVVDDPNLHL